MKFVYRDDDETNAEREANQLTWIAATLRRREVEEFAVWFEIADNWL